MKITIYPSKIKGDVHIPPSKSDSQRAILCAALCKGKSTLYNIGKSHDERNLLIAIKELGADVSCIDEQKGVFEIDGTYAFSEAGEVNIGESGLATRLLTPVLATRPYHYTLNGNGSLKNRSMSFFDQVLPKMGVIYSSNEHKVPLTTRGPIKTEEITVDGNASSQYISGLLMALPLTKTDVTLHVTNLVSFPYVEMTIKTLSLFRIEIPYTINEVDNIITFYIKGNQIYSPTQYTIEGDWSSASYWITAKLLGANISINGLNTTSLQADKKIAKLIEGDITNWLKSAQKQPLTPFKFDATHCPDLFPALVTIASFINGTSIIIGTDRLINKESSRGIVLQKEFAKLGVNINIANNEMHIHGTGELEGGIVSSHHDHRIAMCLGIASLFAESVMTIEQAESVSKSYPDFWTQLNDLIL